MLSTLMCALLAAAPIEVGHDAKILGWTADGRYFAYRYDVAARGGIPDYYDPAKPNDSMPLEKVMALSPAERAKLKVVPASNDGDAEKAELAEVQDVVLGTQETYLLSVVSLAYQAPQTLKNDYKDALPAERFTAWLKAHPLQLRTGQKGFHGESAFLSVENKDEPWGDDGARWGQCDPSPSTGMCNPTHVRFGVRRAGAGHEANNSDRQYLYHNAFTLRVAWDPTGKRLALMNTHDDFDGVREGTPNSSVLHFVGACNSVELVTTPDLSAALPKVREAIEASGLPVVVVGDAKKARDKSVVYATKGAEKDAAKLAAAIPGGATVEPLTWKANGDLVVALGASAR